jgi:hypothetical protein
VNTLAKPLALACCVLTATAATAVAAKSPVPATPATGAPPAGKDLAPPAAPALEGATPSLYTVVQSTNFTAVNNTQTRGSVSCPAGTVAFGGGALIFGSNQNLNINSSFPGSSGSGWIADVDNVSGANGQFYVQVICATAPRKYQVLESGVFTVGADSQVRGSQACPARTSVLGGGSLSNSGSVAVNINSTFPSGPSWVTDQNDNTNVSSTFEVFAICGHASRSYSQTEGVAVSNPAFSQTQASVACPKGKPLSGGLLSSSGLPAVDLNSTVAANRSWTGYEDNTALINGATITPFVICE